MINQMLFHLKIVLSFRDSRPLIPRVVVKGSVAREWWSAAHAPPSAASTFLFSASTGQVKSRRSREEMRGRCRCWRPSTAPHFEDGEGHACLDQARFRRVRPCRTKNGTAHHGKLGKLLVKAFGTKGRSGSSWAMSGTKNFSSGKLLLNRNKDNVLGKDNFVCLASGHIFFLTQKTLWRYQKAFFNEHILAKIKDVLIWEKLKLKLYIAVLRCLIFEREDDQWMFLFKLNAVYVKGE